MKLILILTSLMFTGAVMAQTNETYGLDSAALSDFSKTHSPEHLKNVTMGGLVNMGLVIGAAVSATSGMSPGPEKVRTQKMILQNNDPVARYATARTDECLSMLSDLSKATKNKDAGSRGKMRFSGEVGTLVITQNGKTTVYNDRGAITVDGVKCERDSTKKTQDGYRAIFASTLPDVPPSKDLPKSELKAIQKSMSAHATTLRYCQNLFDGDYIAKFSNDYQIAIETNGAQPKEAPSKKSAQ